MLGSENPRKKFGSVFSGSKQDVVVPVEPEGRFLGAFQARCHGPHLRRRCVCAGHRAWHAGGARPDHVRRALDMGEKHKQRVNF